MVANGEIFFPICHVVDMKRLENVNSWSARRSAFLSLVFINLHLNSLIQSLKGNHMRVLKDHFMLLNSAAMLSISPEQP